MQKNLKINIEAVAFFAYYFFSLCPFVSPVRLTSDLQPFALLVSICILLIIRNVRMTKELFGILGVVLFATICLFVAFWQDSSQVFLCIRKYVNYFSIFIVTTVGFNILVIQSGIKETWIKKILMLWFIVGCIELIYPRFSQLILPGSRTTEGRGVVGLAMEPSFYGYTMFFFLLLAGDFKKKRLFYQLICIFQIVALAQSSIAIVFLGVYGLFWCLEKILGIYKEAPQKVVKIIAGTICGVLLLLSVYQAIIRIMPNSRMVILASKLSENVSTIIHLDIEKLYQIDWSVAERIESILIAINGFADNMGLPHGYLYLDGERIMSGYGTPLYELGWIGLILIVILIKVCFSGSRPHWSKAIAVTATMFAAIQLSSPTVAFYMSTSLYKTYTKSHCGSISRTRK